MSTVLPLDDNSIFFFAPTACIFPFKFNSISALTLIPSMAVDFSSSFSKELEKEKNVKNICTHNYLPKQLPPSVVLFRHI